MKRQSLPYGATTFYGEYGNYKDYSVGQFLEADLASGCRLRHLGQGHEIRRSGAGASASSSPSMRPPRCSTPNINISRRIFPAYPMLGTGRGVQVLAGRAMERGHRGRENSILNTRPPADVTASIVARMSYCPIRQADYSGIALSSLGGGMGDSQSPREVSRRRAILERVACRRSWTTTRFARFDAQSGRKAARPGAWRPDRPDRRFPERRQSAQRDAAWRRGSAIPICGGRTFRWRCSLAPICPSPIWAARFSTMPI